MFKTHGFLAKPLEIVDVSVVAGLPTLSIREFQKRSHHAALMKSMLPN